MITVITISSFYVAAVTTEMAGTAELYANYLIIYAEIYDLYGGGG